MLFRSRSTGQPAARARGLGSVAFARQLFEATRVVVAPGNGFGPGGEGYVRFALIESAARCRSAAARIGDFLRTLG